jgi:hypothetical protein
MSKDEIQAFFKEYVFGFIFHDITREVDHARAGAGGGNLLAALGLLCYTEFLGSFKTGIRGRGRSRKNFNAFFPELGPCYAALAKTLDVYEVFRCGLVHEYLVKGDAIIAMLKGSEPCGIARDRDGRYYFVVERYFEDFSRACQRLYDHLMAQTDLTFPRDASAKRKRQRRIESQGVCNV